MLVEPESVASLVIGCDSHYMKSGTKQPVSLRLVASGEIKNVPRMWEGDV
jgi:hypothetical protein